MMKHARVLTVLAVLGTACASASRSTPSPSSRETPRHLPAPAHLSEQARAAIWDRMQGHGQDMSTLLLAVLFLDADSTRGIAKSIADEPKFARPRPGDEDTINASLPPEFFDLQDELAVKAKHLAEIAARPQHDTVAIAEAYGQLAATCVRCHSVYMYETPDAETEAQPVTAR